MARRASQTLEMVHGSGTLRAGDPGVHLERLPAAKEASNEDRLLTVVSLGLVAMLGVLVARLSGP
jgi:hypothetical protein